MSNIDEAIKSKLTLKIFLDKLLSGNVKKDDLESKTKEAIAFLDKEKNKAGSEALQKMLSGNIKKEELNSILKSIISTLDEEIEIEESIDESYSVGMLAIVEEDTSGFIDAIDEVLDIKLNANDTFNKICENMDKFSTDDDSGSEPNKEKPEEEKPEDKDDIDEAFKKLKDTPELGNGKSGTYYLHKVGTDSNGNWSYMVSKGNNKPKKIQHQGEWGSKITSSDIEAKTANDIIAYYEEFKK